MHLCQNGDGKEGGDSCKTLPSPFLQKNHLERNGKILYQSHHVSSLMIHIMADRTLHIVLNHYVSLCELSLFLPFNFDYTSSQPKIPGKASLLIGVVMGMFGKSMSASLITPS